MKNVLIRGLFLVLGLWSTLQTLAAQDLGKWSKSDGLVVVRTANNPLSAEEEQALEILLQTRLDSTGARLVVVLTDGIQDDINLYAVELGQRWGIGSADEDNGALLLVDLENRQMALQVGYGFCAAFGGGRLDADGLPQPQQPGTHLRFRRPLRRWTVLFPHGRRLWRRLRWRRFWWRRRWRFWRWRLWRWRVQRQLVNQPNPSLLNHRVRV